MGNRAVIAFRSEQVDKEISPAIYLHWHGDRYRVEAFLAAAKHFDLRCNVLGCARLAQIIGNWLGSTLSLGVGCYGGLDTDNTNNGTYWIKDWEIVEREFMRYPEHKEYDVEGLVQKIIAANEFAFKEKKTASVTL